MKRLSWKYVAGLIDGEGCVAVGFRVKVVHGTQGQHGGEERKTIYPQIGLEVTLTESCKHVLDMLQNNYGGKLYCSGEQKNSNWKPTWSWRLYDRTQCRALFQNIKNHLLIKRAQAEFAIWCFDNVRGNVTTEVADCLKCEFKQLKADPHRLSEKAALKVSALMR